MRYNISNLAPLLDGPAPRKAFDGTLYIVRTLSEAGVITTKGQVKSGKRGRPADLFALTANGRKRVKRAVAKASA